MACDYNTPAEPAQRSWLAKRNQVVLREEVRRRDGLIHIKAFASRGVGGVGLR